MYQESRRGEDTIKEIESLHNLKLLLCINVSFW